MKAEKELYLAADNVGDLLSRFRVSLPEKTLENVTDVCSEVQKSWSGSNLGYHAYVYFEDLKPISPGAHFSPEWGIRDDDLGFGHGSDRRFLQYDPDAIKRHILARAGNLNLGMVREAFRSLATDLPVLQRDVISILSSMKRDDFLNDLVKEIRGVSILSTHDARNALLPRGQRMSRDSLAITQGTRLAPHQEIWGEMLAFSSGMVAAQELMTLTRQAAAHLARQSGRGASAATSSRKVFIGHGGSPVWRELKDFLRDTLRLEVEEFGRVPTAGISTTSRLYEMLDSCGFAFLLMTGEDETAEGHKNARLNVIHEIGLFQGRLGASKAIIMLENGCSEFSNIHGLGQIRFPANRVSAAFEQVRQVLRREGIIQD
ncbi:MAG TPA: TIR domain-containing protein [Allosphingosinicella sp.]|nr:TIR domain-containing protein [Allosphingosinicella sp.]